VRLAAVRPVAVGKWAGGGRAVPGRPAIGRGRLGFQVRGKTAGVSAGIASFPALRLRAAARRVGVGSAIAATVWSSGFCAAALPGLPAVAEGGQLLIAVYVRPVIVSAGVAAGGMGQSAGELVYQLPEIWAGQVLPAGYVGDSLAALALVRGDGWALVDGALQVAGRAVLDQYGLPVMFDTAGAEKWIAARLLEADKALGMVWMRPGAGRDALLSQRRAAVEATVRKRAKSLSGIEDDAKRAALVADLDFLQRGA